MKFNIVADGDSDVVAINQAAIHCSGTWDGATIAVYWREIGGDRVWNAVADGAFTADCQLVLNFARKVKVKVTTTGSGASTDLDLVIA